MNILGMGPLEILVVALIAFIFLGPERMTDAAKLLGKAIREGRNIASDIPRVVVEDDEIKVVERGKSTSLINDRPAQQSQPNTGEVQPQPGVDTNDDDGPVPFSRDSAQSSKPDASDSRTNGRPE